MELGWRTKNPLEEDIPCFTKQGAFTPLPCSTGQSVVSHISSGLRGSMARSTPGRW